MEKNVRLADIYIKIYNKRMLTMEDLSFLAKYDRECFEKTCRNLIYNIPETGKLMKPIPSQQKQSAPKPGTKSTPPGEKNTAPAVSSPEPETLPVVDEKKKPEIETLLENLKKMEWNEYPTLNVSADSVKNLLGSLYMEMLFPHNDRYRYFQLEDHIDNTSFNKKA